MTPIDNMVSSRPQISAAGPHEDRAAGRGRRLARRALLVLPVMLMLAIPASGFAQTQTSSTGTSGYNQTPPPPKTTTEPKSGTAPSKEATTPKEETTPKESTSPSTSPEPTSATPAKTGTAPSASKLPFTGLDLRWVIAVGVLLLGGGLSLRFVQRRSTGH